MWKRACFQILMVQRRLGIGKDYTKVCSPSFADCIASNLSHAFIKIFSFVFIFLSPVLQSLLQLFEILPI